MCIYRKISGENILLIGVYVDDLLITATNEVLVSNLVKELESFRIKNLGNVSKFLGMRVTGNATSGYVVDQEIMSTELVQAQGLSDCRLVKVPISVSYQDEAQDSTQLPSFGGDGATIKTFQSVVGSLLWMARCTRPDLSFAVYRATRKAHAPSQGDWNLVIKILKYLKWSATEKLILRPTVASFPAVVEVYTDADWAGDKEDRKSTSGMVLLINGVLISWKCKKQSSVALSTAEAEYVAMVEGIREAMGASECLREIGVEVKSPLIVKCDNQAAIAQVKNESTSSKSKHVDIKYKFVQDLSRKGLIKVEHVDTEEQMADILTKPFSYIKFRELKLLIGLKNQY